MRIGQYRTRQTAKILTAAVVLLAAIAAGAAPASASGVTTVAYTGGQVLFIRPAPNQSSSPIGSYADGATVRVDCFITNGQFITGPVASSQVWHRLNGRSGWVSGVYLRGGAFGGLPGEPRCAGGGGPYAPPATYVVRNVCGLADITFKSRTSEMSVQVKPQMAPNVLASGYKCLTDRLILNWVNPKGAQKWAPYIRNEIRNHAFGYVVTSTCVNVPTIKAQCRSLHAHANPADLDLREYTKTSYKSPQWTIDWFARKISIPVMNQWIQL